jgi:hypothetical protein
MLADKAKPEKPRPRGAAHGVWTVLRSLAVHILPVLVCVTLLWFNIRSYYLGAQLSGPYTWSDTSKIQLLQVAAKIHEIVMVASLATVAIAIVRHRLLRSSEGLPLGLVGAGLMFGDASFLM